MFIQIDNRESDLITLLKQQDKHVVDICQLQIGDVIICNNEKKEQIIIERKSLYDLAASIKDGRYKEQSYRLTNTDVPNHNIFYLIEGDWNTYNEAKGRMDKQTLLSACITINHYKGFSIWKTDSKMESAEWIVKLCDKVEKMNKTEFPFYNNENKEQIQKSYSEVACVNREKKKNIDENNIAVFMLACIPGVSAKTASTIMDKYISLKNLMSCIEKEPTCLQQITIVSSGGRERKINKKIAEAISNYLR